MGASVCKKYPLAEPDAIPVRANPEIIPLVTVWPTPKGFPIASTNSPTSTVSLFLKSRWGRISSVSSLSTAKSLSSSDKITLPEISRPSCNTTLISVAPPTT